MNCDWNKIKNNFLVIFFEEMDWTLQKQKPFCSVMDSHEKEFNKYLKLEKKKLWIILNINCFAIKWLSELVLMI